MQLDQSTGMSGSNFDHGWWLVVRPSVMAGRIVDVAVDVWSTSANALGLKAIGLTSPATLGRR